VGQDALDGCRKLGVAVHIIDHGLQASVAGR
jgi:hypothetical protein